MVYRDTNQMARELHPQRRDELEKLLLERFGHGLEKSKQELRKQASLILKRGRIWNADEYRVLESYLDNILEKSSKQKEIEEINALLGRVKKPLFD
jgi:hypothetical protein